MWNELPRLPWWGCLKLMALEKIKHNHMLSFRSKLGLGDFNDLWFLWSPSFTGVATSCEYISIGGREDPPVRNSWKIGL
jgi:hypothetical protein